MASQWYNNGKGLILDPRFASVGEPPMEILIDRIVPGLMVAAYVDNIDTDVDYADISANGLAATNYVEPGNASSLELAGKAVAVNNTTDLAWLDAADLVYTGIGNGLNGTFDTVVITREQDAGKTEGNTMLLGFADGLSATTTNGGNITLVWDAAGILQITT